MASEATAEYTSCPWLKVGLCFEVVKAGSTKASDLVATSVGEDADPHDAVADDHHGGEDRVAGHCVALTMVREHHRDDQGCLDDRHAEREDQCPEWLTHSMGDDLGMADRCEHRGHEDGEEDDEPKAMGVVGPGEGKRQHADHGDCSHLEG